MTLLEEIKQRLEDLPPEKQDEVLDFIAFLQQRIRTTSPTFSIPGKASRIRNAFKRASELHLFKNIEDPVAWQKRVRQDRPLAGRA
jgi:hypothetical protein